MAKRDVLLIVAALAALSADGARVHTCVETIIQIVKLLPQAEVKDLKPFPDTH